MSLRIRRIKIDGFGPLDGLTLEPADVTVVCGDNESGKSSVVDALNAWLRRSFHRSNATSWERVRRYDGGEIEVELCGATGELPDVLCNNPLLWNLLVIPEGEAATRTIGSKDWIEESKQHLTGFDPDPVRKILLHAAGRTPTRRDTVEWKSRTAELERDRVELESFLASLDEIARRETELCAVRGRTEELDREAAVERRAVEFDRYTRARSAILTRNQASTALSDLARYLAEDLESWRKLHSELERKRAELNAIRGSLSRLSREIDRIEGELRGAETERDDAEKRRTTLVASGIADRAERTIHRVEATERTANDRRWLAGATVALALAALASVVGALLLSAPVAVGGGIVLGLGAALTGLSHLANRRRLLDATRESRAIVDAARALGLEVDSLTETRAAVASAERDAVARTGRLEAQRDALASVGNRRSEEREHERQMQAVSSRIERDLGALCARTGLASLEELEARLQRRAREEDRLHDADAELTALFPDSAPDRWSAMVDSAATDDPGRQPTPGRLGEIETTLTSLREQITELVRATDGRVREQLSRLGLADLSAARDRLVEIVTEQQRRSDDRKAAELALEAIDEAQRDVDGHLDRVLEDADGGADVVFERLTAGRWKAIRRTGDGFAAVRPDGTTLPVAALSRGTIDQLHFALRAALAERVVGAPGFFVWDDTFLTADPRRRRTLVATAVALAKRGWQVVYLTVDPTIADLFEAETGRYETLTSHRVTLPSRDATAAGV